MEFEQIRLRIMSLNEDLKFAEELMSKKLSYETRLWALGEQKTSESFQNQDLQEALSQQEQLVKQNITNTEDVLKKIYIKLLRSLGRT